MEIPEYVGLGTALQASAGRCEVDTPIFVHSAPPEYIQHSGEKSPTPKSVSGIRMFIDRAEIVGLTLCPVFPRALPLEEVPALPACLPFTHSAAAPNSL